MQVDTKLTLEEEKTEVNQGKNSEEVKKAMIKDKVKSSHYTNITLPSNQKPVLIQQVSEKPENSSDSPPSKSTS